MTDLFILLIPQYAFAPLIPSAHPYCSLSHLSNNNPLITTPIVKARKLRVILDFVSFSLYLLLPYAIPEQKLLTLFSNFLSLLDISIATTGH